MQCRADHSRRPSPANVPWELLPEEIRQSNRESAIDFFSKLQSINVALIRKGNGEEIRLSPEELETLSRMEHDRWCAEKIRSGWRHGKPRDNQARIHPDLVAYEELSDEIKQKDRDKILDMIEVVTDLGWVLSRAFA